MDETKGKTYILIDVDLGDPQGEPEDFGLDDDCTAADVIAAMKESGSIQSAITDWNLNDCPIINVTVLGPNGERSYAEWKWNDLSGS